MTTIAETRTRVRHKKPRGPLWKRAVTQVALSLLEIALCVLIGAKLWTFLGIAGSAATLQAWWPTLKSNGYAVPHPGWLYIGLSLGVACCTMIVVSW